MKARLANALDEERIYHTKVLNELEKLPNHGNDCNCDFGGTKDVYSFIYYGEEMEIVTMCLKCGGTVWSR